jgi:hypothetical protein
MGDFGLMFYNARWYDPALGRFVQADTVIPGGLQGLDRYAYVTNNPLKYVDPSGHCPVGIPAEDCQGDSPSSMADNTIELTETDTELLIILIVGESTSGWVPLDVDYQKAWALLNKISYDIAHGNFASAKASWGSTERGVLTALDISEISDKEIKDKYRSYRNGKMSVEGFTKIESEVRRAISQWKRYGSRSFADPVRGAVGYRDLSGMRDDNIQSDGNGVKLEDRLDWIGEVGNLGIALDKDKIEANWWRKHYGSNRRYSVITDVYPIGWETLVDDKYGIPDDKGIYPHINYTKYTVTFFVYGDGDY